jgi:hypothetical protein
MAVPKTAALPLGYTPTGLTPERGKIGRTRAENIQKKVFPQGTTKVLLL